MRVTSARLNSECIGSKVSRRPKVSHSILSQLIDIQKTSIPQKQPRGFKEGINLFKYQLDALSWMKSVEDDLASGFAFMYASTDFSQKYHSNTQLLFPGVQRAHGFCIMLNRKRLSQQISWNLTHSVSSLEVLCWLTKWAWEKQ